MKRWVGLGVLTEVRAEPLSSRVAPPPRSEARKASTSPPPIPASGNPGLVRIPHFATEVTYSALSRNATNYPIGGGFKSSTLPATSRVRSARSLRFGFQSPRGNGGPIRMGAVFRAAGGRHSSPWNILFNDSLLARPAIQAGAEMRLHQLCQPATVERDPLILLAKHGADEGGRQVSPSFGFLLFQWA